MKKTVFYLALLISIKGTSQSVRVPKPSYQQKVFGNTNAAKQHISSASLLDSTYYSNWNTTTGTWGPDSRLVYGYNTFNNEINLVNSSFNNNLWQDYNLTTNYVYDVNNNLLSKENQFWNLVTWENSRKSIYTYDNANNQLTYLTQTWNSATSNWDNFYYSTFSYNSNNKQLTFLSQHWDSNTAAWVNADSDSTHYNINDEIVSDNYKSWNPTTSSWEDAGKGTNYVYANGDLMSFDYQYYDMNTSTYITVEKYTNTYDGKHHLLGVVTTALNQNTSVFDNYSKENYTYNTFGDQITYLSQTWDTISNSWKNSDRQFDYYSLHTTSLNVLSEQNKVVQLFPNPANNYFIIESNTLATFEEVKVTDITGKMCVLQKTILGSKVDISHLQPGVYSVELKSAGSVIYKKLVKE